MRKMIHLLIAACLLTFSLGLSGCEEPEVEDLTPTRVSPDDNATMDDETPYEEEPGVVE